MANLATARLTKEQKRHFEAVVTRFEEVWGHFLENTAPSSPVIDAHLPPDEPVRGALVEELSVIDLDRRLSAGLHALAEQYLQCFPELAAAPSAICRLLAIEYRCQMSRDPRLQASEFMRRYRQYVTPELQAALQSIDEEEARPSPSANGHSLLVKQSKLVFHKQVTLREQFKKGGMGRLWLACDEFDNEVVVKEVRPENSHDPHFLRKLRQEARITALLTHNGIPTVYALNDEHDSPRYVMQYVSGSTLADAITDYHHRPTRIALRHLLGSFVTMCKILDYAHVEKSVLHLDLSPDNVMLDDYGQTFVIDWGLAREMYSQNVAMPLQKAHSDSMAAPVEYHFSGRGDGKYPYMAPEQIRGTSMIGATTDVYGLGSILYQLLLGEFPYADKDRETVMQMKVAGVEPDWSPEMWRRVPAPLQAICRKAMAMVPEKRYDSARCLATAIENWLDDQRVAAYDESIWESGKRCVRQHKLMTLTIFATFALLLSALLLLSMSHWLDEAWEKQSKHLADLNEAKKKHSTDLAEVTHTFAETSGEVLAKYPLRAAIRPHESAIRTYSSLVDAYPDNGQYRRALALFYNNLAITHFALGEMDSARKGHDRALALRQKLCDQYPDEKEYRRDLAASLNHLGLLHYTSGSESKAYEFLFQSRDALRRLVAECGDEFPPRRDLAKVLNNWGMLYLSKPKDKRDSAKVKEAFDESLRIWDDLLTGDPNQDDYRLYRAKVFRGRGELFLAQGEMPEAQRDFETARAIQEKLVKKDSTVFEHRRDLALTLYCLGRWHLACDQREEALKHFEHALNVSKELATSHEALLPLQRDVARYSLALGDYFRDKRPDRAEEYYRTSRDRLRQFIPFATAQDRIPFGKATVDLAWVLTKLRRYDDALKLCREKVNAEVVENPYGEYLRTLQLLIRVHQDDHRVAEELMAMTLEKLQAGTACYNLVCAFAQLAERARVQKNEKQMEGYVRHAIKILREEKCQKYFQSDEQLTQLDEDADLKPLRNHPEYIRWRNALPNNLPAKPK